MLDQCSLKPKYSKFLWFRLQDCCDFRGIFVPHFDPLSCCGCEIKYFLLQETNRGQVIHEQQYQGISRNKNQETELDPKSEQHKEQNAWYCQPGKHQTKLYTGQRHTELIKWLKTVMTGWHGWGQRTNQNKINVVI